MSTALDACQRGAGGVVGAHVETPAPTMRNGKSVLTGVIELSLLVTKRVTLEPSKLADIASKSGASNTARRWSWSCHAKRLRLC